MEIRTIENAMEAFHVTREQLQKVQAHLDGPSGAWYYLVESQHTPGLLYCVAYNRQFKVLQCLPWQDGQRCPASEAGYGCWHRRASMAVHALFQAELRTIKEAEVARALAERTPEEIVEQRPAAPDDAAMRRMADRWAKLREFKLMR